MLNFIENFLCRFETCFSRKASFRWFAAITIGLMLRSDSLGITSVIRDFALSPGCYDTMLHFFRASSWSLEGMRRCWFSAVKDLAPLYGEGGFHVLVGDGVKQSKEGRWMPGVKKLFQESENSAKPEYIHGHMFGGLGILAGQARGWACIPLSIWLHDGLRLAAGWEGADVSCASHVVRMVGLCQPVRQLVPRASHVVRMVEDAYAVARAFGDSLLLLDRYFLTTPVLERPASLNCGGSAHMEIVIKAKKSCTAFEKPGPRKPGRRRHPKKGAAVHLKELFLTHKDSFREAEMELYGKKQALRYHCTDLLWGQGLYREPRFVLVEMEGTQSILAGTSLGLDPLAIIRLYSYRFRIECTFRELKQQMGAFCYRFWSKHMPKLGYYRKKGEPSPLECVEDGNACRRVLEAVRATEMHMALSCIAMGVLQCISLNLAGKAGSIQFRYQRTPSGSRVSEAAVMHYLRKQFFCLLWQRPELRITQIIQELQDGAGAYWGSLIS